MTTPEINSNRELLLNCVFTINGKVVTDVLHVIVTEEQFKQYRNILLRGMSS